MAELVLRRPQLHELKISTFNKNKALRLRELKSKQVCMFSTIVDACVCGERRSE